MNQKVRHRYTRCEARHPATGVQCFKSKEAHRSKDGKKDLEADVHFSIKDHKAVVWVDD